MIMKNINWIFIIFSNFENLQQIGSSFSIFLVKFEHRNPRRPREYILENAQ